MIGSIPSVVLLTAMVTAPGGPGSDPGFSEFLASRGLTREAGVERLRQIEACPTCDVAPESLSRQAGDLVTAGHADVAVPLLQFAQQAASGGQRDRYRLSLAVAQLVAGEAAAALAAISRVEAFAASDELRERAQRIRCIALLSTHQAPLAAECLRSSAAFGTLPSAERDAILADLDRASLDVGDWPTWAGILSAVLPGLGQALSGELTHGAGAFAINGASGLWVFDLLRDGLATDAVVVVAAVWMRFYIGNIVNAHDMAERAHERARRDAIERASGRLTRALTKLRRSAPGSP